MNPRPALLLALGVAACEDVTIPPAPPAVLAVDVVDNQVLLGGVPARSRLWTPQQQNTLPPAGPDLSLRFCLSVAAPMDYLKDAATTSLVVVGPSGESVNPRGFRVEAMPGAGAPAGTVQELTLVPDLRSGSAYALTVAPATLVASDGTAFIVPPTLQFQTARRFVVERSEPAGGSAHPLISAVRLFFSSVVATRVSADYDVTLSAGGAALPLTAALADDGRSMTVTPACPLPLGQTQLLVPAGGVEEDSTLAPLAQPFSAVLHVTQDPGPCAAPDMAQPDMAHADM